MSQQKIASKDNVNKTNYVSTQDRDEAYFVTPEFIYGGPFIEVKKPSPFIDTATPINLPLQGTFRQSFAYFSLKDRIPIILTKIIDYLSRDGAKIKSACGASDEDIKQFMQTITKLKNDLVTNKEFELLKVDTPEAKKWNEWIDNLDNKKYFNNVWLFSECYIYRKLYEGCELTKGLKNFDYFEEQKKQSFESNLELMCIVADKLVDMWNKSEKDKRKADFVTLLKLCLWANKCDLSLSMGENVVMGNQETKEVKEVAVKPEPASPTGKTKGKSAAEPPSKSSGYSIDPFQMIIDLKDKLLIDDTNKIADQVVNKAESLRKAIEGNTTFKYKCSCHRLATAFGVPLCPDKPPEETAVEQPAGTASPTKKAPATPVPEAAPASDPVPEAEAPKIPCPAKMTLPNHVLFDIVCDNAGYELFADLCLASFLIEQNIVQKVRFHVKKMPWYVSDVTPNDFKYTINACMNATFKKEPPAEEIPENPTEGKDVKAEKPEEVAAPKALTSDNLKLVGEKWNSYVENGTFVVMAEDYWTYPHAYCDMKKYDYDLYRKLQYAVAILFKGDLNYRKLLADKNVNPYTLFEPCLQGFIPAPIIAARTVKADLICGMPKSKPGQLGKYEQLQKLDEHWMRKGDYGLIQFCAKGEALKVSDRPCIDYGDSCRGVSCPDHEHDM